ncbi:hypothetical protein ACA910_011133 [Epithemia clementina (nom. ined.)]
MQGTEKVVSELSKLASSAKKAFNTAIDKIKTYGTSHDSNHHENDRNRAEMSAGFSATYHAPYYYQNPRYAGGAVHPYYGEPRYSESPAHPYYGSSGRPFIYHGALPVDHATYSYQSPRHDTGEFHNHHVYMGSPSFIYPEERHYPVAESPHLQSTPTMKHAESPAAFARTETSRDRPIVRSASLEDTRASSLNSVALENEISGDERTFKYAGDAVNTQVQEKHQASYKGLINSNNGHKHKSNDPTQASTFNGHSVETNNNARTMFHFIVTNNDARTTCQPAETNNDVGTTFHYHDSSGHFSSC